MRVGLYYNTMPHQAENVAALGSGIADYGDEVRKIGSGVSKRDVDCVVTWGWRNAKQFWVRNIPVLVLERGYIGDRMEWTSAGWDGLNGRSRFITATDEGERFKANFALEPYRENTGRALVFGQVRGDSALQNVNIAHWYADTIKKLQEEGWEVTFRPHPDQVARGAGYDYGVPTSVHEPLRSALGGVSLAVGWNTSATVEALCAGVPVVTCDIEGSIAGPMSGRTFDMHMPDRSQWAADLAWKQFRKSELAAGETWDRLRGYLDGRWNA